MYVSQQIESQLEPRRSYVTRRDYLYRVVFYRVTLDARGVLRWERWRSGKWHASYLLRGRPNTYARRDFMKGVPAMASVSAGRRVSMQQAVRLTGIDAPVAMDYLMEHWDDGIPWDKKQAPTVTNFVAPAKPKKAPLTALAIAMQRLQQAQDKVLHYERQAARCETFRKKWVQNVKRYAKRVAAEDARCERAGVV